MYLPHLDATDIVQPIDAGYGRLIKQKMRAIQEEWLEDEDNMNLWIGNTDEKLNVAKRRILITHWAGAAFEMLQGEDYKPFLRNCFERTGCLLATLQRHLAVSWGRQVGVSRHTLRCCLLDFAFLAMFFFYSRFWRFLAKIIEFV